MQMPSFLKLNTGVPQMPSAGGYTPAPQLPTMRAPTAEVVPAGYGPITDASQFPRAAFVSHPPMGGRAEGGLPAIMEGNVKTGFWPY